MLLHTMHTQFHKATSTQRRVVAWIPWIMWAYLLLLALAEIITFVVNPLAGQAIHAILLLASVVYAGLSSSPPIRKLALALALAPMTRILSLSLPLIRLPQLAWYPAVAVPLLLGVWLVIRRGGFSRHELGLSKGQVVLQVMLAGAGAGLGWIEYLILAPQPLVPLTSWAVVAFAAIILALATGFPEELIFRGVLQSASLPILGRWGILYVSLVFAVLHIGYLSFLDVIFVFLVGLLFAFIVLKSQSILGVTLVHALTNIFLFLIMPHVTQDPSGAAQTVAFWITAIGSICALNAAVLLLWNVFPRGMPTVSVRGTPAIRASDGYPIPLAQFSNDAYEQLLGQAQPPLVHVALTIHTPVMMTARLRIPAKREALNETGKGRVQVYCNGILLDLETQLLPRHFQYVEGVVSLALSPAQLNSGLLEDKNLMRHIGRILSKQLSKELFALADSRSDMFRVFWSEFGSYFSANQRTRSHTTQQQVSTHPA